MRTRITAWFFLAALPILIQFLGTEAAAQSNYFTSRGCSSCHAAPVVASCNGCHYHGNRSLKATTDKTSYAPGETVRATLTSGSTRSGWIKAILYNQAGNQVAASSGNASGVGGATTFPATLSAPAPTTPGSYIWKMAYFGNQNGTGSGDVHTEAAVSTNSFTVAVAGPPADATVPTVTAFTMPATTTSLTVPVTSFTATDNVAATGYLITTSATKPSATASGWSTTPPTSVTATTPGSNTFYAWVKDAAGNVSLSRSANVTITLPDATAPSVTTFTLPATASSLTVPVTSFTATDNVAATGYLITTSATAPSAGAPGWTTSAPSSITATEPGSKTFYAWVKDAAGNVSAAKTATVTITLPASPLTLTLSTLPEGSYTNNETLNISGKINGAPGDKTLSVNDQPVTVLPDGTFATALTLKIGENPINIVASDSAGTKKSQTLNINYDPVAPLLTIETPSDNSATTQSFVNLKGTVDETSKVTVAVNDGSPQSVSVSGNVFTGTVNLKSGVNTIDISAVDLAGNTAKAKRTVTYETNKFILAITYPNQDITTRHSALTIKGNVSNSTTEITVKITVDDQVYTPAVRDGKFRQQLIFKTAKLYAITVTASDSAGNSSSVIRNVIYRPDRSKNDADRDRQENDRDEKKDRGDWKHKDDKNDRDDRQQKGDKNDRNHNDD